MQTRQIWLIVLVIVGLGVAAWYLGVSWRADHESADAGGGAVPAASAEELERALAKFAPVKRAVRPTTGSEK